MNYGHIQTRITISVRILRIVMPGGDRGGLVFLCHQRLSIGGLVPVHKILRRADTGRTGSSGLRIRQDTHKVSMIVLGLV